jgi:hypothetical protein
MKEKYTYWKRVAFNMLFTCQALFLGTTAWDFFLTVIVQSHRSLVFTGIGASLSTFIILPWIIGIFVLMFMLLLYMANEDKQLMITRWNFDYIGMIILYVIMFVLALTNPVVAWPILLNYLINIAWAGSLIYFRLAVRHNKAVDV